MIGLKNTKTFKNALAWWFKDKQRCPRQEIKRLLVKGQNARHHVPRHRRPNARDQNACYSFHSFLVKVHKKRASISLHICHACSIVTLILGLRAPLVAHNKQKRLLLTRVSALLLFFFFLRRVLLVCPLYKLKNFWREEPVTWSTRIPHISGVNCLNIAIELQRIFNNLSIERITNETKKKINGSIR